MRRGPWSVLVAAVGALALGCSDSQVPPPDQSQRIATAAPGSSVPVGAPTDLDAVMAAGESAYLRGEFDEARALWRDALADAEAGADSLRQGRILTRLASAAWRQSDYREARRLGERAVEIKLRAGLAEEVAASYNLLGLVAWHEGRLDEATDLFRKTSEAARLAGDDSTLAKAANNLALVETERGQFRAARSGFLEARAAFQRLGDGQREGMVLSNLGMLDAQLGDPASAIEHLTRALELYRPLGYETGIQNALGQLATAYDALGEPRRALAALDTALTLARTQGLRQEEASDLELMAGLYRQAGDLRRALRLYEEANRINAEIGLEVDRGNNLRNTAEVQIALGRTDLARSSLEEALAVHRGSGAQLQELRDLLLLADLASRDGKREEEITFLGDADRLAARLDTRTARVEVALAKSAIADRTGDSRSALAVLRGAQADLARGGYGAEWQAAAIRARAHARLGQLDSAAAAGRAAVAAVERVRGNFGSGFLQTSFVADKASVYADLVEVLLQQERTTEAFAVADASRSRALLHHLASAADPGPTDATGTLHALAEGEGLLRQVDSLVARLDALEEMPPSERPPESRAQGRAYAARLAETREAYEALLVHAAERDAAGTALLGGQPISAEEVQGALRPGEVLVEYLVAPDRVTAFVATGRDVRSLTIAIAGDDDLARRVRLARDLLGQGGRSAAAEAVDVLAGLHDVLVAPLERAGLLSGAERLVIVPHVALAYLPFAALRHQGTGKYLVEQYALLHLPSAAALVGLRGRRDRGIGDAGKPAVFAPFPGKLPATRREARAFQRAMPGAVAHAGRGATEARLRDALAEGHVVHVASHGIMNPRNPLFSRIELARGGGGAADDGRLEVHELLALRIGAPLVFLSGCETGVGNAWSSSFARGEDYATLAQAFLYAGAGSVVATLWPITDDGAAAFAERFYARLDGPGPVAALALAQRDLLAGGPYASPHYWAAYLVSGDGGRALAVSAAP